MAAKPHLFRILLTFPSKFRLFNYCGDIAPCIKAAPYSYVTLNGARFFTDLAERVPEAEKEEVSRAETLEEVLRKWGCDDSQVAKMFQRHPPLRNAIATKLESRLSVLSKLGLTSDDLVRLIHIRPFITTCHCNHKFDERVDQLKAFFVSRELLVKAIVRRNPSLLVYNFHEKVEPVFALYEGMGMSKRDFISMLLVRPTLISLTNMCEQKLEYIRRTGVTKESKMFKYVVTIFGVSRITTISEKIASIEKFGIPEDEVLRFFGRYPVVMTLSVDKIQRNMSFVVDTMKLPASTVVAYPFLLNRNLELFLKPRVLLADKMQDMGLEPEIRGRRVFTALRMTEERFVEVFIGCYKKDVRKQLLAYYKACQGIKREAVSSKKNQCTGGFLF